MTVELDDPGQYGRIVRDADGGVERIVETKHPETVPSEILATKEINTGTYLFHGPTFAAALDQITNENEAGEYYLGDVLPLMRADGHRIAAHVATDPNVNLGVNTRSDLALAEAEARRRINDAHMLAGVAIADPASTWIDADVEIAQDARIEPGCALRGVTDIGEGTTIGPHTTIISSAVGKNSTILRSHLDSARVGDNCQVGPFAYLRPGADLANGSKAGTFVEVKNSKIGEGAKVPHLAYIGDADVGAGANVGAGSITANYDGKNKHRTKIGEGARIAVNNSLVAPVEIGDGAYTGAGAVIRSDVPPGALGVSSADQRNIEDYADRKTKDAEGDQE
jgi:bifunctional UDP-N-acetylglucosamine pyrophosphorylase/glucosamine-1-phosphate N-acetyltransferase